MKPGMMWWAAALVWVTLGALGTANLLAAGDFRLVPFQRSAPRTFQLSMTYQGPERGVVPRVGNSATQSSRPVGTALVDAAQKQDKEAVRVLMREKIDVNTPQADGATALAWAAHWDDLETADLLIAAGANVNAANDLGVTPLMLASANGSPAMVETLLKAGADSRVSRSTGETALMMAARTGSVPVVKMLLTRGVDVNAKTARGQTALMWAAAERHAEVARVLIDSGADVQARASVQRRQARSTYGRRPETKVLSKFEAVNPASLPRDGEGDPPRPEGGFTPLLHAVLAGDLETVRVLLAGGANVNEAGPDGVTPLILALTKRHEQLALFLLEQGADANKADSGSLDGNTDFTGYSALHVASATGQLAAVKALLARGANPNASLQRPQRFLEAFEVGTSTSPGSGRLTQTGATPFMLAAKTGHIDMMRALASGGADPKLATSDGTTALMLAAGLGKRANSDITYYSWTEEKAVEAIKLGLELGIDINAANEHGETALHAAAYHAANQVIQFLVANGANVNALNAAEQTPFLVAEGHLVCCTTFVRHPETGELLRKLGANPALGIRLNFGLTAYGEKAQPK